MSVLPDENGRLRAAGTSSRQRNLAIRSVGGASAAQMPMVPMMPHLAARPGIMSKLGSPYTPKRRYDYTNKVPLQLVVSRRVNVGSQEGPFVIHIPFDELKLLGARALRDAKLNELFVPPAGGKPCPESMWRYGEIVLKDVHCTSSIPLRVSIPALDLANTIKGPLKTRATPDKPEDVYFRYCGSILPGRSDRIVLYAPPDAGDDRVVGLLCKFTDMRHLIKSETKTVTDVNISEHGAYTAVESSGLIATYASYVLKLDNYRAHVPGLDAINNYNDDALLSVDICNTVLQFMVADLTGYAPFHGVSRGLSIELEPDACVCNDHQLGTINWRCKCLDSDNEGHFTLSFVLHIEMYCGYIIDEPQPPLVLPIH